MSKEIIRPDQFCSTKSKMPFDDETLITTPEQLAELEQLYEGIFKSCQPGKLTKATIVRSDSDGVLVDIHYKSHGLIPKYEFGPHELKNLQINDEIEVLVDQLESSDGHVVVSYERAKALRAWDRIVKLFESEEPVEGVVTHKVKGGLSVDVGIDAFLPGSQIDLQRVTDFDQYVGQTITAHILKINRKRGNVIISRRKYLSDMRAGARKSILTSLDVNQILQGIVKNITNYGAFIDIGGVDGLLHITDMTWGRIAHPSELLSIGETITVKVLSFDKNTEKISLGLKQLNDNPWANIEQKLVVGQRIKGKVSSITDYGLFVEVAPNIEGLVHISEISWTSRIENLHSLYKVGQEIDVLLVSLDRDNRRMSLSVKQLDKNPWDQVGEQFAPGQRIEGMISNITDFGIFVQLIPGIDGLVHISDLSWTEHIEHPRDRYKIGQKVAAVILSIDKENKKISLGIKQLEQDPWTDVEKTFPINSIIEGTVTKITNFGAFVKLANGIEGLVHNTTLQGELNKKAEELFSIGQTQQFRVVNVSQQERKLALSTILDTTVAPSTHAEAKPSRSERPSKARAPRSKETKELSSPTPAAQSSGTNAKTKSAFQLALESALKQQEDTKKKD